MRILTIEEMKSVSGAGKSVVARCGSSRSTKATSKGTKKGSRKGSRKGSKKGSRGNSGYGCGC